jgi:hypothetical protein
MFATSLQFFFYTIRKILSVVMSQFCSGRYTDMDEPVKSVECPMPYRFSISSGSVLALEARHVSTVNHSDIGYENGSVSWLNAPTIEGAGLWGTMGHQLRAGRREYGPRVRSDIWPPLRLIRLRCERECVGVVLPSWVRTKGEQHADDWT